MHPALSATSFLSTTLGRRRVTSGRKSRSGIPEEWTSISPTSTVGRNATMRRGSTHGPGGTVSGEFVYRTTEETDQWRLERERLDKVVGRILFQAGLDYQGRTLLVMCPSQIPEHHTLPGGLHALLSRLLTHATAFTIAGPYSLVILASPSTRSPSLKQLIFTYFQLDPFVKKNVKMLYVVHPSFWTKLAMSTFLNGIVSWKVNRKFKSVRDLSALAVEVPISQINIPPEVYKHDLTLEASVTIPLSRTIDPVFGISLNKTMGQAGPAGLPQLVKDCIACIRSQGILAEGIFRRPPASAVVRTVSEAYDRGHPVTLSDYPDAPFISASLLKCFIRHLPQPIFTASMYSMIRACPQINENEIGTSSRETTMYIQNQILPALNGKAELVLLASVMGLMHDIACHSEINKMDARNLAICLCPVLIRSSDLITDAQLCKIPPSPSTKCGSDLHQTSTCDKMTLTGVIEVMITSFNDIFQDVDLDAVSIQSDLFLSAPVSPDKSESDNHNESLTSTQDSKIHGIRCNTYLTTDTVPSSPPSEMVFGPVCLPSSYSSSSSSFSQGESQSSTSSYSSSTSNSSSVAKQDSNTSVTLKSIASRSGHMGSYGVKCIAGAASLGTMKLLRGARGAVLTKAKGSGAAATGVSVPGTLAGR